MASSIYGFTADLTKQLPRGIANVYVKITADTGYSTLGKIRNGKAHVRSLQTNNTKKQSQPFSAVAEHTFEMLQCSLTELELLDTLCNGNTLVIVETVDSQYYVHNAAATQLGIKYRVVNDAKIDTNRFIEISMKVGLIDSELDTVMPSSAPTLTSPATGDTFWAIANTGVVVTNPGRDENILPAGVATAEICARSESSYDDMGEVTNFALTFETFGRESDKLRYRNVGIKIDGSFETLQDSNSEKANLDLIHTNGGNFKFTHFDGLIWTLTNKVGMQYDEGFDGDFDDHKTIKYTIDGSILMSEFDGVVSHS